MHTLFLAITGGIDARPAKKTIFFFWGGGGEGFSKGEGVET